MKLKTEVLKDAVTRASKGASNNKLIPLTSLMNILVGDNSLLLTTTDSSNYFTVKIDDIGTDENYEVSVNADVFTKLVQKMTSESISIEVLDSYLMVVGNGKYKIDLLLDENGNPVKFSTKDSGEPVETGTIPLSKIKKILTNNKASLSVSTDVPCLMNYYCGESIITTDRYKICQTKESMLTTPALISPTVMELLSLFSGDTITYYRGENSFSFDSTGEFLYAPFTEGIDKMPVKSIEGLINSEISSKCLLSKDSLMNVLDRLSLFVSPYDKNGIYLTFSADGLSITSKKSNGNELIEFTTSEVNPFEPFTCQVDIEMLTSQVATISSETVELYFGSPIALKFVDGNVTKIVALMEDDRID